MRDSTFLRSIILGILFTVSLAFSAVAQDVSRYAIDDAIVHQYYPDSVVQHTNNNMLAYRTTIDGERRFVMSFVKFTLPKSQIDAASFSIRGKTGDVNFEGEFGLQLSSVKSDFDGDSVTFATKPARDKTLGTLTLTGSSARQEFEPSGDNLINYINEEIRKGAETVAFEIRSTGKDSTDNMWIGGAGDGSFGPIFEYTLTPEKSKYAIDDAIVHQYYPDSVVQHTNNNMLAYRTTIDGERRFVISFVKFTLPKSQVDAANFSIRGKTGDVDFEGEFGLQLSSVKADFDGSSVTFATKPARDKTLGTMLLTGSSARQEFELNGENLVNYMNEEIRKGAETIAFEIRSTGKDSTDNMWIGGAGDGSFGPILNYTITPEGSKYSIEDAIVHQYYPDSVIQHTNNNMLAYRTRIDGERQYVISFVKFNLPSSQVDAASFSIRGKTGDVDFEGEFGLQLSSVKADFDGSSVTFATKPARDKTLGTMLLTGSSARQEFEPSGDNLVNYINEEIRKGAETIAFEIRSTGKDSTENMWIGGTGDGSFGPILEYTVNPNDSKYGLDDAIVHQYYPDSVIQHTNNNMLAYRTRIDGERQYVISFVKFGLPDRQVEAADFSVRAKTGDVDFEGEFGLQLSSVKSDFDGSSVTFATKPARDKTLGTLTLTGSSARQEFEPSGDNLINYINEEIRKGAETIAFEIRSTGKDSTDNMWIGGIGDGSFGPILNFAKPGLFGTENDTLVVMEDVFVAQSFPDSNFTDAGNDMHLIKTETSEDKEIYLKFNIAGAKVGVGMATLILQGDRKDPPNPDDTFALEVFGTDDDSWDEDVITWNTKPATNTDALASYTITESAAHSVMGKMLTKYVNDAIKAEKSDITFVVKGKTATAFRAWISEQGWKPAKLALDYSTQEKGILDDTWVHESFPDSVFDDVTAMEIVLDSANDASRETYLKFDIKDGRPSELVTATLRLRGDQQDGTTELDDFFVQVFGVADTTWKETELTWNTKPMTETNPLAEQSFPAGQGSIYHEFTSAQLTDYIKSKLRNDNQFVAFAVKGKEATPGTHGWVSSKAWQPAELFLDYRNLVADPEITPEPGLYVPEVTVGITTSTAGASIYYTTDGSEPTDASMMYTEPVTFTDSVLLKAVAMMDGMAPSKIIEAKFDVSPTSMPEFDPNPAVEYQDQVTVTLTATPDSALIFYSDAEGVDPSTPYPEGGITLTETTTIRAVSVTPSGDYTSPVAEATYTVVNTVAGTGVGPGGVGFSDNTISGQPENALWLKPETLTGLTDEAEVTSWPDASGNENHAYNSYVQGGDNGIPNTVESQKPAPNYIASALNGHAVLDFGEPTDQEGTTRRTLIVDDADNLDGGAGISIFMVFKRNEMFADFAAVLQKRDVSGGPEEQAYVLEFDGGSNPHRMQFVVARDLFLKQNVDEVNDEDYYVVNVEVQAQFEQAIFRTNGEALSVSTYRNIIQATDATMILGGFQAMNIAEVIVYKNGLNAAQNRIVHSYLAGKYGLEITSDGTNSSKLYSNTEYVSDIVGVGKETYLDGETEQEHKNASGGGLELELTGTYASGDFVMAGHNGASVTDGATSWARVWNVETTNTGLGAKMAFNFATLEVTAPTSAEGYKLFYDGDGNGFTDTGLTPTLVDGEKLVFDVTAVESGLYAVGVNPPGSITVEAPTFDIAEGEYDQVQTVAITSATADASIYYTLDGSTPTTSSTAYTEPITLTETTTLKAIAAKDGAVSTVTTAVYTITGLLEDMSEALTVFPNPTSDKLQISLDNGRAGRLSIRVYDYAGRQVFSDFSDKTQNAFEATLNLGSQSVGLYLVEIIQGDYRAVKRIVKD